MEETRLTDPATIADLMQLETQLAKTMTSLLRSMTRKHERLTAKLEPVIDARIADVKDWLVDAFDDYVTQILDERFGTIEASVHDLGVMVVEIKANLLAIEQRLDAMEGKADE